MEKKKKGLLMKIVGAVLVVWGFLVAKGKGKEGEDEEDDTPEGDRSDSADCDSAGCDIDD